MTEIIILWIAMIVIGYFIGAHKGKEKGIQVALFSAFLGPVAWVHAYFALYGDNGKFCPFCKKFIAKSDAAICEHCSRDLTLGS